VGERNRAGAAETEARQALALGDRHLAMALVAQAVEAARRGARPEAEVMASAAMALRPSPEARGVLATFGVSPPLALVSESDAPSCEGVRFSRTSDRLLCLEGDAVSLWETNPLRLVWRKPWSSPDGVILEEAGVVGLGMSPDRILVVDESSGDAIREYPSPGSWWGLDSRGSVLSHYSRGFYHLIDLAPGGSEHMLKCPGGTGITAPALTRDGGRWALWCQDGTLRVGEGGAELWSVQAAPPDAMQPSVLEWVLDDERLAFGTTKGHLGLVDARTGEILNRRSTTLSSVRRIEASPDGTWALVSGEPGEAVIISAASTEALARLPVSDARRVQISQTQGAVLSFGDRLARWRVPQDTAPVLFGGTTEAGLSAAALSADGALLALARGDGNLEVVATADGRSVARLSWQRGVVKWTAFSTDDRFLIGAGMEEFGARVFDTRTWSTQAVLETRGIPLRRVVLLRGDIAVGPRLSTGVAVWRDITRGGPAELLFDHQRWSDLSAPPGGSAFVAVSEGGGQVVLVGRAPSLDVTKTWVVPGAVTADTTPDGARVAISTSRSIFVMESEGAQMTELSGARGDLLDVALSRDGAFVSASTTDGSVMVWRVDGGELVGVMRGHSERVPFVQFEQSGDVLLSASWDSTARLWDLRPLVSNDRISPEALAAAWRLPLDRVISGR
jgi:WD40 repeat protein